MRFDSVESSFPAQSLLEPLSIIILESSNVCQMTQCSLKAVSECENNIYSFLY